MMKIGVFGGSYVDTVSGVEVAPYLYFVVGTHKNIQRGGERKETDADTMDCNNLLRITHNVCVPNVQLLLQ